jgi:hypothetical protein
VHIFLVLLVIVFCSEVDNHFPVPSTTAISSSVSPYNSYTSLSIAPSVASICRDSIVLSLFEPRILQFFVQVQHLGDEGDHAIVPGNIGGVGEVD